jgi:hypothetical protein
MQVSETLLSSFRGFLKRDTDSTTAHLPADDPFARGIIAGQDIGLRSALQLFDMLFPEVKESETRT